MKININKKSVTLEFNSQKEKEKFIASDLFKQLVSLKETLEIDKIEELSELEKAIRKAIEQFDWDKYWLEHPINKGPFYNDKTVYWTEPPQYPDPFTTTTPQRGGAYIEWPSKYPCEVTSPWDN